MGYQDVDELHLTFADQRAGLEVTATGLSMGDMFEVLAEVQQLPGEGDKFTPEAGKALRSLINRFAPHLMEWNVEDRKGQPVPATLEGLLSLKPALVMDIVTAWVSVQNGPDEDDPLGKESGSGGTSPEALIPMEPLSPSHGNSPGPG